MNLNQCFSPRCSKYFCDSICHERSFTGKMGVPNRVLHGDSVSSYRSMIDSRISPTLHLRLGYPEA